MKASEILQWFECNPDGVLIDEEGSTYRLDKVGTVIDQNGSRFLMNIHIEADLVSKQ